MALLGRPQPRLSGPVSSVEAASAGDPASPRPALPSNPHSNAKTSIVAQSDRGFLPWRPSDAGPRAQPHPRDRAGIRNPSQLQTFAHHPEPDIGHSPVPPLALFCKLALSWIDDVRPTTLAFSPFGSPQICLSCLAPKSLVVRARPHFPKQFAPMYQLRKCHTNIK